MACEKRVKVRVTGNSQTMNEIVDRVRDLLAPLLEPLEIPLRLILEATEISAQPWWFLVYDIIAITLVFVFLRSLVKKVFRFFKKDTLADRADIDAMVTKNQEFVQSLEAAKDLESTIAPLKKAKDWARLGEIYAALNRPKDAAKWFRKARDHKRFAQELAKAGQTVRAAKALLKSGDFETAGRFFLEKGKFVAAAKAFSKHGDVARAAETYRQGGKFKAAFALFAEYFRAPRNEQHAQIAVADSCYTLLRDENAKGAISEQDQETLSIATAAIFEQDRRFELAAKLFSDGGDLVRAGFAYATARRFQDAIATLQKLPETDAGYSQSRALLGRCFYELHDYARCAATLENHLLGKRVEEANTDYFYMLALAFEQLGKLNESRDILHKIAAVRKEYRGLSERISNIDSRISMLGDST